MAIFPIFAIFKPKDRAESKYVSNEIGYFT